MVELASKETCTGCATCANVCPHDAIRMREDKEGFLFPLIDTNKCVECKLCQKTCPIVTNKGYDNSDKPKTLAFWSKPDRTRSSSGGAFSAIARWVLQQNGIVFGAAFDENLHVKHIAVHDVDGLAPLRGSKYMQSRINDTFRQAKEALRTGKWVLFTGTPCQIAGIKSYINKRLAEKLILVDIACHGAPSQKIFLSYIKKVESNLKTSVHNFSFRKTDGWGFITSVNTNAGHEYKTLFGINNLYMYAFDRGSLFRKSCYACPFAHIPRQGDLSIADYWGIGRHGDKFNKSTMRGVSLILVNNEKGSKILEKVKTLVPHFIEERNLQEAVIENQNLVASSSERAERDSLIEDFINPNMTLSMIDRNYSLVPNGLAYKVKMYASRLGIIDYVKELYSILKRL